MRRGFSPHTIFFAILIWLASVAIASAQLHPQTFIWTIAGDGGPLNEGGPAIKAHLYSPSALALDAQGNLYIACEGAGTVRKVIPSGIISTVAGSGQNSRIPFGDGGPATSAYLGDIQGLALDSLGNLYIAENDRSVVRKVDTGGIITTIAGNYQHFDGYAGDGGPATEAEFNGITSLAVDSQNNLYISDTGNSVVRKVDTNGIVTTVVGNGIPGYSGDGGPATSAQLNTPLGLAFDPHGNLLIADGLSWTVRKVDTSGIISTIAGNGFEGYEGDGGPATSAEFSYPAGLTVDQSGNIYISDPYPYYTGTSPLDMNVIRKVDAEGIVTTYAGNGYAGYAGDGNAPADAKLYFPYGLATDSAGGLYIADLGNNVVRYVETIPPPKTAVATPTFTPSPGSYSSLQSVFINDSMPNAEILYTLDGTAPTTNSLVYFNQAIYVNSGTTIRAIAVAPGYQKSPSAEGIYKPSPPPPPTFSPAPGKYIGSVTVTLQDSVPGGIHYTLDGSEPSPSAPSTYYYQPITLVAPATRFVVIRAIAVAGVASSEVLGSYSIVPQTPAPTINPSSGSYSAGQPITITDSIPLAEIRYTTDGLEPTIHSILYRGPIALTGSATIRALSIANGEEPSTLVSATYTLH